MEPATLGMCFDQESNPQSFDAQDDAPTNWPPGQGTDEHILYVVL